MPPLDDFGGLGGKGRGTDGLCAVWPGVDHDGGEDVGEVKYCKCAAMARSLLLLALCGLAASFTTSRNALSVAPVRQTASAAPEMKFRVCDMTGKRRNAKAMTVTFSHTRNHKVGLVTPHRAPDGRRRRPRLERGAGNGRSRPFGDALRPAAALRPRRRARALAPAAPSARPATPRAHPVAPL